MALKSWNSMCLPKANGRLGFYHFFDLNKALLTKLRWKVALEDDNLWAATMQHKYLRNKMFFECKAKQGDSFVWKGILSTKDIVQAGACYRVGDGTSIDPWKDPWILWRAEKHISLKEGTVNLKVNKVADFIDCWNK